MPTLLRCSRMDGVQVIVADNDSKDDSMEMMQREFPEVPLIRLEKNWGFAKGYNMALGSAYPPGKELGLCQRLQYGSSSGRGRILHTAQL